MTASKTDPNAKPNNQVRAIAKKIMAIPTNTLKTKIARTRKKTAKFG